MAGNSFGNLFKITTFGESHGVALGVVIDGVPPNLSLTEDDIQKELNRRMPGQSKVTTQRKENDSCQILSGVFEGKTSGTPLTIVVFNQDQRSKDYSNIKDIFRPGHADLGFFAKYGIRDYRGGGRSSGRETLARVAAGAVAKKILKEYYNISIVAYTKGVGGIESDEFVEDFIEENIVRSASPAKAKLMEDLIIDVAQDGDSIGGLVECRIRNLMAGVGNEVFDKLDAELAKAMLSIGGVKGIEFGDGFNVRCMRGSLNNDPMRDGKMLSNHAGGILGGHSTGAEVIFRLPIKPTPSISLKQETCDVENNNVICEVKGRHDPCLCPRVVVVVEAMAAITVLDQILFLNSLKLK
ncbi:MAG: chorismate synthase [Lentisphaeria bacterium]|nr:chorismate synthase [Lentisphaeria bacterium]